MNWIIVLVLVAAFVGAFCGTLAARGLPDIRRDLNERAKLKRVLPEQTFKDQWGRNVPAYLWKRHGLHRRRRN